MNWQNTSGGIMLFGFPAWMHYWISSPHFLIYMYAILIYAGIAVFLFACGMERK